ncbi:uncharacterized protein LOC135383988 [Ornithodoros turicata]|uniref:uncharacterized protein LOC135383988 n=1 Tax=Ornithodoros turicata TaxID=34597 RepID=UPI003138C263
MFATTFLCALIAFATVECLIFNKLDVQPCKSAADLESLKEFRVTHCHTLPCKVTTSDVPKFEVDFVAKRDSDALRVYVKGSLVPGSTPTVLPAFNSDACNNMGVECPVTAGKQYTAKSEFKLAVPGLPPSALPLSTEAVFSGKDAGGEFFCFKVPVVLSKP